MMQLALRGKLQQSIQTSKIEVFLFVNPDYILPFGRLHPRLVMVAQNPADPTSGSFIP